MSLLGVMIFAGCAWPAVTVNGKDIDTIGDILREARSGGIVNETDSTFDIEKASLLRLHDGQLDLTYNIGNGNTTKSLGKIRDYIEPTSNTAEQDDGLLAAVSKTNFNGKRVVIGSSKTTGFSASTWFYDLYFLQAVKEDNGNITQSRFGAWRYPYGNYKQANSTAGHLKDIKTGIFVNGYNGELVVTATMESTYDGRYVKAKFSDKKVNARLDFWSLYQDASGNLQYRKLDSLTAKTGYMDSAPLNGVKAVPDYDWSSVNNMNSTAASPYMLIRCAVGDFNNDGYANEVAMLTTNPWGIDITLYQISYYGGNFSIRRMTTNNMGKRSSNPNLSNGGNNDTAIYLYNNPNYVKNERFYNGFNRVPGADIVAADVDGDGQTELIAIWQGDFPANEREVNHWFHGANVKELYCDVYKWNTSTSKFEVKSSNYNYEGTTYWYITSSETWIPWGGLKAVRADLDGDGKDEVVIAYFVAHISASDTRYTVDPRLLTFKRASDGSMTTSSVIVLPYVINGNLAGIVYEYNFAPVWKGKSYYPVVDREVSLAAGPFFDEGTDTINAKDGIAFRYYGGTMKLFKGVNGSLQEAATFTASGTSALVAADFLSEGITLGSAVHVKRPTDRSYTAILQAPPYHVDNIATDGMSLTTEPVNFSYVNGATTTYERGSSSGSKETTKFDIHNTVETSLRSVMQVKT